MITEKQLQARINNALMLNASGKAIHKGHENGRWKGGARAIRNYPCPSCGKDRMCEGRDSFRLCKECGHKKRGIESTGKRKHGNYKCGESHHNWNGGITSENKKLHTSFEYRNWRRSVFQRDKYTCQMCGAKNGEGSSVYLHADHIKPFSIFPELRFEITNGRTLCRECHSTTPTYKKSIKQLKVLFATDPTGLTYSYT